MAPFEIEAGLPRARTTAEAREAAEDAIPESRKKLKSA